MVGYAYINLISIAEEARARGSSPNGDRQHNIFYGRPFMVGLSANDLLVILQQLIVVLHLVLRLTSNE